MLKIKRTIKGKYLRNIAITNPSLLSINDYYNGGSHLNKQAAVSKLMVMAPSLLILFILINLYIHTRYLYM